MPRLFTGIELPPDVREALARVRMPLPGAKWVEPENLHITLRFAGDIDNRVASEFAHGLAAIDGRAFPVRVAGLGAFGGNDPRVVWAGVEAGPELEALARANERAARAAGLPPEKRGFRPHVTLARLKHARADAVARFLGRNGHLRCEPFLVSRFVLLSSRPKVGGGPYVVEDAFPLQGAGVGEFPGGAEDGW
jgi:2'-5' RNA ligase